MNSQKKICILTTSFPRWKDDSRAPFILEMAKSLEKKGVNVEVITMHSPNALTNEIIFNVRVVRLRYLPDRWEFLQSTRAGIPSAWKKNPFTLIALFLFILRSFFFLLRNGHKYEIIHSQWTISALVSMLYKPFFKGKLLVTLHGSDVFLATKLPGVLWVTKKVLRSMSSIICVSEVLKAELLKWGIDGEKIRIIPNGVDLERFNLPLIERLPNILYVGSLTKNKNVATLIKGFAKFEQEYPDFYLTIIGEGLELGNLKKLGNNLGIDNKVKFLGSLSPDEVAKHMLSSSIFVLPSINEGFGVVLIEAMAAGLPCLGTKSGAIPYILQENPEILFDPLDFVSLSKKMTNIINNKNVYTHLQLSGKRLVVEKYNWEIISGQILEQYYRTQTIKEY